MHGAYLFKVSHECGSSKAKNLGRTPGGSSESITSPEDVPVRQRGVKHVTSAIHAVSCGISSTSNSWADCSTQGSENNLHQPSPDTYLVGRGCHNKALRPGSTEISRRTSSSSSPTNSKDSLPCDEVISPAWEVRMDAGGEAWQQSLTWPVRSRPSSPGSEMVTLEEFLEESKALSSSLVKASNREDVPTDYFGKAAGSPGACCSPTFQNGVKAPASYFMPPVKPAPIGGTGEARTPKPGQSVKPNVRVPETPTALHQSQTLPNWVGGSVGARAPPLQLADTRGGLSRTFSLASADLLHSNGPESYRQEETERGLGDVVLRRSRGSARLMGTSPPPMDVGCRPLDPRRLSFAPPKESFSLESPLPPPQHHSSSSSLCGGSIYTPRHALAEHRPPGNRGTIAPQHRAAEVAMVTPVRAAPALEEEEEEVWHGAQQDSPSQLKWQEAHGGPGAVDKHPKSSPAPPSPSEDPQTVWYEYGCV